MIDVFLLSLVSAAVVSKIECDPFDEFLYKFFCYFLIIL
jgi:hypothetical protein